MVFFFLYIKYTICETKIFITVIKAFKIPVDFSCTLRDKWKIHDIKQNNNNWVPVEFVPENLNTSIY